jgi:hypothetical protein
MVERFGTKSHLTLGDQQEPEPTEREPLLNIHRQVRLRLGKRHLVVSTQRSKAASRANVRLRQVRVQEAHRTSEQTKATTTRKCRADADQLDHTRSLRRSTASCDRQLTVTDLLILSLSTFLT